MSTRAQFAGTETVRDTDLAVAVFVTRLKGAGWYRRESWKDATYYVPSHKGEVFMEPSVAHDHSVEPAREVDFPSKLTADRYYVEHGEPEPDGRVLADRMRVIPYYCSDRNALHDVVEALAGLGIVSRLRDHLNLRDPLLADPYDVCVAAIKAVNEHARMQAAKALLSAARRLDLGALPDDEATAEFVGALDHARMKLVPPWDYSREGQERTRVEQAMDYIAWRCGVTPDEEGWVTPSAISNAVHTAVHTRDCYRNALLEVRRTCRGVLDLPITQEVKQALRFVLKDLKDGRTEAAVAAIEAMMPGLDEATKALRPHLEYADLVVQDMDARD